jgi:hypothetical protein
VKNVFGKYFRKEAPFGDEKKKYEFPDAFILEAVENWCTKNDEKMYIISKDKDWEGYAKTSKKILYSDNHESIIDNLVWQSEHLSEKSEEVLDSHFDEVKDQIENLFPEIGFWIEDQHGEVEDVEVTETEMVDTYLFGIQTDSNLKEMVV